jgi:hypothetical protein
MKKGDIVKPKPEDKEWIEYIFKSKTDTELTTELLTLKEDPKTIVGCGPDSLFVQFEETGSFVAYAGYFEVVLESGKPDVKELMKQVEAQTVFA